METQNCKYKPTDNTWLYIFVIITMMASCSAETKLVGMKEQLNNLEKKIELIINQPNNLIQPTG